MRGRVRVVAIAMLLAVSACTSTPDVLEPSALIGQGDADTTPPANFPETAGPDQSAAVAGTARIQFAPVVGAPGTAAAPLSARLSARAGERGVALLGAGQDGATHVLKGYFSAIADGGETTVIYVWDVMDPAGNRVHRMQGQARSSSRGGGWEAVEPATMEAIADQTVDQLVVWLASVRT
jgi:hypothetical protein